MMLLRLWRLNALLFALSPLYTTYLVIGMIQPDQTEAWLRDPAPLPQIPDLQGKTSIIHSNLRSMQGLRSSDRTTSLHTAASLLAEIIKTMQNLGLDTATYTISLSGTEPGHTLLYHLIEIAVAREEADTHGIVPALGLPAAGALSFLLYCFIAHDWGLSGPVAFLTAMIVGVLFFPSYFLNAKTSSSFEHTLDVLTGFVREAYLTILSGESNVDEETRNYIKKLCHKNPLPYVITEVFSDLICKENTPYGA